MTDFNFGYSEIGPDFNFTVLAGSDQSYDFLFGENITIHSFLFGTSNNFHTVWADPNTSLTNGKLYVGRKDDMTIIDSHNNNPSITGYFGSDVLESNDSVDANVINAAT